MDDSIDGHPTHKISGLKATMDTLAQIRDEQRLKMHLAKADVQDEWQRLEARWSQLQQRYHKIEETAEEAAKDIWAGVEVLIEEIGEGYDKIRRAL